MNDKEMLDKMNKDENYRSDVLINFNFEMQLAQSICYAHENKFSPQEYKLAVVSLEQENARLKEDIKNIINILRKNCDDLEATEEEFESLYKWQNE